MMRFYGRRSKYGNRKCEFDGHKFDSEKERTRYVQLKQLMDAGKIIDLQVHPKYILAEATNVCDRKLQPIRFTPDFKYYDRDQSKWIVEDVKARYSYRTKKLRIRKEKPFVTKDYVLRRNLFLRQLPNDTIFLEHF